MSDTVKHYWDEEYPQEKIDNKLSEDVVNILETFKLLSVENKIIVKRLIKTVDIFA
jgi:hypothetical protein